MVTIKKILIKLLTTLNNLLTKTIITDGSSSSSNKANGYIKFLNGIIIQGGHTQGVYQTNTTQINFNYPFPNACLFAMLNVTELADSPKKYLSYINYNGGTKDGIEAAIRGGAANELYASSSYISYIAIGY